MIRVEGPDGVIVEFPADTSPETIKGVMARKFGGPQQPKPQQSTAGGMLDAFTQGAAFGFGDELTGLESAILGRTPEGGWFDYSKPFGERYQRAVDAERGQQDAFGEQAPVASTVANVAGALATGMGAGRAGVTLMRPGLSTSGAIGRGAVEGAAYGGLYGAGEADEGDRLAGAAWGAGTGGATGGALSGAAQQVAKVLAGRTAATQAPASDVLKRQGGALIDKAAAANPTFDKFDDYVTQVYKFISEPTQGIDLGSDEFAGLARWVNQLEELSKGGTTPTLQQLRMLRGRLNPLGENINKPSQRRAAKILKDALDNYMDTNAAAVVGGSRNVPAVAGATPDPRVEAMRNLRAGNDLYRRGSKGALLDKLFYEADINAAKANSGMNFENALRQRFATVLKNPRQRAQFSKSEIEAIERVVKGDSLQNVMRWFGNMAPTRGILNAASWGLGTGGAAMAGAAPLAVAGAAASTVADALARAGTRSQAQAVSSMVRGGPNAARTLQGAQLPPAVAAIVRALSGQAGSGAAGLMVPSP